MARAPVPPAATQNYILSAVMPASSWTYKPPVKDIKQRIARAKKDVHARKFFNKGTVGANDMMGAISFWIGIGAPPKSLEHYLASIMPPSGWIGSDKYDGGLPAWRRVAEYGAAFKNIIAGYWSEWDED